MQKTNQISNGVNKLSDNSKQLYEQWEQWWNKKNNLTWVGKQMLKVKQKCLKEILQSIKPSRAIDVGCGQGHMLSVFKEMGIDVIGIDISETSVKICRNKGLPAIHKKLEEINDKYDLVFSDGMLEHFLNFEPYAQHHARISNQYVLIIQTDHESFLGKTSIYFAELLRDYKNLLEYNYRIKDFVSVFEKYGFKLIQEKRVFGGVFKLLLFQKSE